MSKEITPELSVDELATVERFGIHDEDADQSEWCVHVTGPDDVLPARDILDAVRQAHAINEGNVGPGGYYSPERAPEPRPHMTLGWAVPSRREWLS